MSILRNYPGLHFDIYIEKTFAVTKEKLFVEEKVTL